MRLQTLFAFLLPLIWACIPGAVQAAGPETISHAPEFSCQAPAPTGLGAGSATPTSISLAWIGPASSGVYYEVSVYDLTTSTPQPSVFTTSENAVVTGLTTGHWYQFKVRASYCGFYDFGKWSDPANAQTGVIIIDELVEFHSTSGSGTASSNIDSNAVFDDCVARSTTSTPNYDKGLIYNFGYRPPNGAYNVSFGLVLPPGEGSELKADLRPEVMTDPSKFRLEYVGTPPSGSPGTPKIKLSYSATGSAPWTPIISAEYDHINSPTSPSAVVSVHFKIEGSGISTMSYWNSGCSGSSIVQENHDPVLHHHQDMRPDSDPDQPLLTQPSPNPFSTTARCDYTVPQTAPVNIRLFDAMGRLSQVVVQNAAQEAGTYEAEIDGANLPNGVYFLHVRIDGELKIYRLVKQE